MYHQLDSEPTSVTLKLWQYIPVKCWKICILLDVCSVEDYDCAVFLLNKFYNWSGRVWAFSVTSIAWARGVLN